MVGKAYTGIVAAALLAVGLPATALADHPAASRDAGPAQVTAQVERALGGEIKALDNGLFRVHSARGYSYTTHGPDYGSDLLAVDSHGSDIDLADPQRDPVCATDYYQEVLYGYPTTGTNQLATKRANIQAMIKVNDAVLNEESLASGGSSADFKVLCETDGSIKVSAFPVDPGADARASFTEVVNAAKAAGYGNGSSDRNVDHTIFYDGLGPGGVCGTGYFYGDESAGVNNLNNNPGFVEGGYAASYDGCWFNRTSLHETAHNQGAVQYSAPDSTGDGAHCNEVNDVMCYRDGGDLRQDYPQPCATVPGTMHFDCGWDSYFDSAPEAGEYLAGNWNVGSSVNRFIQYGPDASPPDTAVTGGPNGLTTNPSPSFSFVSTEGGTFACSLDGGAYATCSSPKAYANLADGPHTFAVAATDVSNNVDPTPASRSFTVDATPPDTAITEGPGAASASRDASFAFNSADAGATFQCSLDNSPFAACSSPQSYSNLPDGSHVLHVRAIDGAANVDPSPASHSFAVDATAPETTIDSGPNRIRKGRNAVFGLSSSEPGSSFECRLDGAAFAACDSPLSLTRLKRGRHTLLVRAGDALGNLDSTPAEHAFKVRKKR